MKQITEKKKGLKSIKDVHFSLPFTLKHTKYRVLGKLNLDPEILPTKLTWNHNINR